MTDKLELAIEGGIARITMNDGKVNAMSSAMLAALGEAFDEAERAGAVVVLRGRPGMFSAGFDLPTFKAGREATIAMLRAGAGMIQRILGFGFPVLTVCTGHAYPAGAFLMMAADSRLGVAGAWRIGMNETAIGLTLPHFAVELARHRLTPPGFARVSSGALFDPRQAAAYGYLDHLFDEAEIEAAVEAEASRLRALDMPAFAGTKARINAQAIKAITAAVESELGA